MKGVVARLQVLGGLGSGIAAAAVSPASAQGTGAQGQGPLYPSTAQPVQHPITKYPQPPYTFVKQPWPGLASKMQPPPDHGEKSYQGSGRLLRATCAMRTSAGNW